MSDNTTSNSQADHNLPQLGRSSITEVIAAMTPEEKVNLLIGTGSDFPGLSPKLQSPVVGLTEKGKVPGAAGNTFAIPRLGIPSMVLADGPAGVRISPKRENEEGSYYCTAFPIATMLASTWDAELLQEVGAAMGEEALEYGVDILLGPAVNIHRNPLGGRNFEYFSEDPLVSGKLAAAIISGIQAKGVGTSIKHFVANDHEWNRHVIDVKVEPRALREIYLRSFEIAIKSSKPWTVMSSYNKLNGVYASEHSELLTTILRDQWGFSGLVMTDWYGGRDPLEQLRAGNDLLMPGSIFQQEVLLAAIQSGELDGRIFDRDIENILSVVLKSPVFKRYQNSNRPNLKLSSDVALRAAQDGIVLLQNREMSLPISKENNVALFGNTSYKMITGGTGSGNVNRAYTVSLLEGLRAGGFNCNQVLENSYIEHIDVERQNQKPPQAAYLPKVSLPELRFTNDKLEEHASVTDVAIITIGRHSGEFVDRKEDDDFNLSLDEQEMIEQIADVYHRQKKKVIVILNICGIIECDSWREKVDAILLVWQPGQEAGHAVASAISGKINPSGKLATSFALHLADHPSHRNFPGVTLVSGDADNNAVLQGDKAAMVEYSDDIWVGYRSFITGGIATAYPFGFGLSYTSFSYDDLKLSHSLFDDKLVAKITVTNAGKTAGREIVQLYITAPDGKLSKPRYELRGFAKTSLLQAGESQEVTIEIREADLVSFDSDRGLWEAEAGTYRLLIGASSSDIRAYEDFQLSHSLAITP